MLLGTVACRSTSRYATSLGKISHSEVKLIMVFVRWQIIIGDITTLRWRGLANGLSSIWFDFLDFPSFDSIPLTSSEDYRFFVNAFVAANIAACGYTVRLVALKTFLY
jgi:hypothetical protein